MKTTLTEQQREELRAEISARAVHLLEGEPDTPEAVTEALFAASFQMLAEVRVRVADLEKRHAELANAAGPAIAGSTVFR